MNFHRLFSPLAWLGEDMHRPFLTGGPAYFERVTNLSQESAPVLHTPLVPDYLLKTNCPDSPWKQFIPKILVSTARSGTPNYCLTVFWAETLQKQLSLPLLRMNPLHPPQQIEPCAPWIHLPAFLFTLNPVQLSLQVP